MGFWAEATTEPKRSYRFVLEINGIEKWTVKRVKRPDFTMTEVAHEYINHKFWYPGRVDWSPMNVTLVDPVKPDTTGILLGIIMASGYRLPIDATPTMTPNKAAAVNALESVVLYGLASTGVAAADPSGPGADLVPYTVNEAGYTEKWTLHNPWIKSVEFGDYSYSDDSIIDLSCTIRYDFAKYQVMSDKAAPAVWADRTISADNAPSDLLSSILTHGNSFIAGNAAGGGEENS